MQDSKSRTMTVTLLILLILTGIAAGMLGGLVGIGGGVIIVPALIYFAGFSQHQAQGTSLGLLMLPVGVLGVLNYYKKGYVDWRFVLLIAAGFVLGSYLGSKIAVKLPALTIKRIFAVIMILLAIKMLFFDRKPAA